MVSLVPAFQPAQDRDRVLHRRLADEHLLEPARKRRILLDPLPELIHRGRTDHLDLPPGQHRLEHPASVQRALSGTSTNHGMELVDEHDDLAVALLDLAEHFLEAILELGAVPRARHHRAEVQRDQSLAAQRLGHVAGHDPLRQPFGHSGLTHATVTDQHRVVPGPLGQHQDDAADLGVAADHRVQHAVAGAVGEVNAILLQSLVGILGVRAGHPGAGADLAERLEQRVSRNVGRGQHGLGLTAIGGQADQQVLGGDVPIAQLPSPAGRGRDRRQQPTGHLRRAERSAAHTRQPGQALLGLLDDQRRVGADHPQQRRGRAVRLLDQSQEQMQGVDLRAAVRRGAPHRRGQRVLALAGQLVVHLILRQNTCSPGRAKHPATCRYKAVSQGKYCGSTRRWE